MNSYHRFILVAVFAFELPKIFYILKAFKTGEYHPVPQFADVLDINPSKSSLIWILLHWFIGNVTILTAILTTIRTFKPSFNETLESIYKWTHFILICTIIFNATTLGGLSWYTALAINASNSIVVGFAWYESIRNLDFAVISIPVLVNVLAFVIYCVKLGRPEYLIFYICLNYIALR